ncbi:MAG: cytochrome c biogenesis protein CcsA [Verrucomicrobiota bacterium]
METSFISLSCIPYLMASAYTCYGLGAQKYQPRAYNMLLILVGFIFQTAFLIVRGNKIGHCPLSNLFETMIFLSWAIVLNYLIIGPIFRVSLLGTFTAPCVLLINLSALLIPGIDYPRDMSHMSPILELHAGVSLLAYGTLGLASIAAVMFLIENKYLKSRSFTRLVFLMPAIGKLDRVAFRVGLLGLVLLTVGLGAGFLVPEVRFDTVKVGWSMVFWFGYVLAICGRMVSYLSPLKYAWFVIILYGALIGTFGLINEVSKEHQFAL